MNKSITVETVVKKDPEAVWKLWTGPEHIMKWCHASDDWECSYAENDVRVDGKFLSRLAAKDGSVSFDFTGTYTEVVEGGLIAYTINDGRNVRVTFDETVDGVKVTETFEMEYTNSEEMQRAGWQAILESFRLCVEHSEL